MCNGKIYDENEDIDISSNTNLVAGLYLRKQSAYTENKIFPYATIDELDKDLLIRVRKLANFQKPKHPWVDMSDLELLKSAGLYLKDTNTGKEGITLAGILIFGNEQLIQAALPHYKTDAIMRKINLDRYDDRDDIRVNLMRSYERLLEFVRKHLNDKFYLEGIQRISVRDKILREAISNTLIHREFANPFPAKFIIERDRVYIENANKAHVNGIIDLHNFSPFPKNPKIAKFFKEIGWVDELGSGVRFMYKYNREYSGADPVFIDEDIFKTIIPLVAAGEEKDRPSEYSEPFREHTVKEKLLDYCVTPRSRNEMQEYLGYKNRDQFRNKVLSPLVKEGLLKLTLPTKPTSPSQQYYSVKR